MANYGINIDVKVKTRELTNFNLKIKQTNERINEANKALERFVTASPRHIRKVSQSFSDLNQMVNRANEAFNKSTLGTPQAVDAARNLVRANQELNVGLEKRAKLLEIITFEGFAPGGYIFENRGSLQKSRLSHPFDPPEFRARISG